MNSALSIVFLLAAVAALANSAAVDSANRLNIGWIGANDRLLHRQTVIKEAIPNQTQWELVNWQGVQGQRITAIRATEVGASQWANARSQGGGIGTNWANIRFQSSHGRGYHFELEIYGQ